MLQQPEHGAQSLRRGAKESRASRPPRLGDEVSGGRRVVGGGGVGCELSECACAHVAACRFHGPAFCVLVTAFHVSLAAFHVSLTAFHVSVTAFHSRWVSRQYDVLHSDEQWSGGIAMVTDTLWPNGVWMEPW